LWTGFIIAGFGVGMPVNNLLAGLILGFGLGLIADVLVGIIRAQELERSNSRKIIFQFAHFLSIARTLDNKPHPERNGKEYKPERHVPSEDFSSIERTDRHQVKEGYPSA